MMQCSADDDVVSDLHEVVDLGAGADPGPSEAGAIHATVRADLDVVVDLDDPDLLDLFVAAFDEFEAEPVGADDDSAVEDDAVRRSGNGAGPRRADAAGIPRRRPRLPR